jgi:aspartyl-tRNA(Asn)/glutamyl-tRNA(Gln) amidotransferase subunit C
MPDSTDQLLSLEEVRHIAKLARLELSAAQLEQYRSQLATVLEHIGKLNELDVTNVEPMAHPSEIANRLDSDQVQPSLALDAVLANAPAVEDRFLAVPKVLADTSES